jgi:hypothetical protein
MLGMIRALALITIYFFNYIWDFADIPFLSALLAAAVLGAGEWFFHKLIDKKIDD